MSSLSPCATRAAARTGSSQASSFFCSPRTARATSRLMSAAATSNNKSTNESMTPASSTKGNSSIFTLTAGTAARGINNGEAENDSDDVDFVDAGRGGGFDDDLVGKKESGGEERNEPVDEELPPLHSIFDCAYIVVRVGNDGKELWECRWCSKIFAPKHASRALCHVLKIRKNDIAVCKTAIPEIYHKRYSDLYKALMGCQTAKKRSSESVEESVAMQQNEAVGNLLRRSTWRGKFAPIFVCYTRLK
jgi:hypothetical protein